MEAECSMTERVAPHKQILDLTFAALVIHRAIYTAAQLKIPDLLATGARSSDEVARETGSDANATYRLMRSLASAGVLAETAERRFELTELGETLVSDARLDARLGALQRLLELRRCMAGPPRDGPDR